MLDRYLSYAGQRIDPVFEDDFGSDKATTEQLYKSPDGQANGSLTTVFGYWHATEGQLKVIADRLNKRGSDALIYGLHPDVLNPDPVMVRESLEEVAERSSTTINRIGGNYSSNCLLGFSLGNIPLSMASENIKAFDKVTMVVPGTDLLTGLHNGIRTQRLRQLIEDNGATYKQLEQEWADLAPVRHLQPLIGHDVEVILSEKDEYIPYRFGKLLTDVMSEVGIEPSVQTHKFIGHSLAILNYVRKI